MYPDPTVKPGHIKVVTTFRIPDKGSNARRVMEGWIHDVWPQVAIEWTLGRLNPRGVV